MEIASFSGWLASRNRELFKMARELENASHKEKARQWRSRAFQDGSRVEIASFSEWLANRKNTEMKKINASLQPS